MSSLPRGPGLAYTTRTPAVDLTTGCFLSVWLILQLADGGLELRPRCLEPGPSQPIWPGDKSPGDKDEKQRLVRAEGRGGSPGQSPRSGHVPAEGQRGPVWHPHQLQ